MKRIIAAALSVFVPASAIAFPSSAVASDAGSTPTQAISYNYAYDANNGYEQKTAHTRQMEKLGRGLVAVKSGNGVYLSWRLLDSEDNRYGSAEKNVSFKVYRGDTEIATVTDSTNYTDTTIGAAYSVAAVINGVEGEKCDAVSVWSNNYIDIPLQKPANETIQYTYPYTDSNGNTSYSATYSFFPADCSTGDLDGDGEYEIVVKWTSSERDVGSPGDPAYSGTVHLAAYKLNGTKMWQNDIELGKNVYSSAHTVQFLVYDFDGDGKAEITSQTSLGSKDGTGAYVSHAAKSDAVIAATGAKIADFTDTDNEEADYRGYGRVITGEEFLTVFSGETGAAIDTIDLPTARGTALGVDFGDDFGNRSNRFLSAVAYLDGEKPYAIYMRGYYFGKNGNQRTSIAGVSFDGERLSPDYRFDTQSGQPGYYEGAYQYVGQGNHNCTVADVDNDGKDEFITGAACYEVKDDNSFKPRWCTYKQHGDALHIGDYDPTHPGFEFFTVHEDGGGTNTLGPTEVTLDFGMSVIDADTGEIIFHEGASGDTGRGMMANIGAGGFYQINGSSGYLAYGGTDFQSTNINFGKNFRIFWDGDLYDELLNGTGSKFCDAGIDSYNSSKNAVERIFTTSGCSTVNDTKNTPALTADLFGDWREELVIAKADGNTLRVYTTTTETDYKIKTLMHDPVYRSGVAAEQTTYNQPPHVGFYMGEEVFLPKAAAIELVSPPNRTRLARGEALDTAGLVINAIYEDGTSGNITNYSLTGYDPQRLGTQTITATYAGKSATFEVTVVEPSISLIDGTYETNSTGSVLNTIPIGSYKGAFTIEHTVTINSMPANGDENKNSTAGFFVRFNPNDGTGAGWYLTANGSAANVYWKSGSSKNNATAIATGSNALTIGETYTFRYDFTQVGDGTGALVTLTVTDSDGEVVGSVEKLNLRNLSNDNQRTSPLGNIQIYNQANAGSAASVTFSDASLTFVDYSITQTGAQSFKITVGGVSADDEIRAIAARYDGNKLENIAVMNVGVGETDFDLSFEPDKVFLWNGMQPLTK